MQKTVVSLFLGLVFIACGSTSSDEENRQVQEGNKTVSLKKGFLVDAPVEGVNYRCGSGVDGTLIEGVTTSTGEFSCVTAPVNFSIGTYALASIDTFTVDGTVYPQDLLGIERRVFDDPKLMELIQLLQSLDDDGNISEGIHISEETSLKVSEADKGLNFDDLVTLADKELVSKEDAKNHLQRNMPAFVTEQEENREPVEEGSSEHEAEEVQSSNSSTSHTYASYPQETSTTTYTQYYYFDSDGDGVDELYYDYDGDGVYDDVYRGETGEGSASPLPSPTPVGSIEENPEEETETSDEGANETSSTNTNAIEVDTSRCSGCHGVSFEKSALNESRIVQNMTKSDIKTALRGYQNGTYGGDFKGLMQAQVGSLSEADIEAIGEKFGQ